MSNTVKEAPVVEVVKLSEITVQDGFNPRGEIDKASISDLTKSMKQDGLLQPVLVRKDKSGYKLVTGHRRIMAAKEAGLENVPVLVRENMDEEEAKAAAFDENEQREDMVPMARAIALKHQHAKLGSYKKVAERRSLTAQQVGALVKMCDLPEEVQQIALANREFGPDLAKPLIDVAAVPGGQPLAVFLANQAMARSDLYRRVRDDLRKMLREVESYRDGANSKKERESVPFLSSLSGIEPSDIFDTDKAAELTARGIAARQVFPDWGGRSTGLRIVCNQSWDQGEPGVEVSITAESFDRLVAAKSALVFEDEYQTSAFVFDPEVIAAEVEQIIETAEKQAKAELKEREKKARREAEAAGVAVEDGADPVKEQLRLQREEAKEAAAKARINNEAIGAALLKRGASKALAKKDQTETIRLMAKVLVRQADDLAAVGMRLCFPAWKDVEIKELKSGVKREKVHYLEPKDAEERLLAAIDNAKSIDELLRVVTDALVAATFSDQRELPQSKRARCDSFEPVRRVHRPEMGLIDRLAKGVMPDDVEKIREKSVKAGYEKSMFSYRR